MADPSKPSLKRLSDSYMMWVTRKDEKLDFRMIPSPLDTAVWHDAGELNKRWQLRQTLYIDNPTYLDLVARGQGYADAAKAAEEHVRDVELARQIHDLEIRRQESIKVLADAEQRYQELAREAQRAENLSKMGLFIQTLSVAVPALTAVDGTGVPSPNEMKEYNEQMLKQADDAGAVAAASEVSVRQATEEYVIVHKELYELYGTSPDMPADRVPLPPPTPMTADPDAKQPGDN